MPHLIAQEPPVPEDTDVLASLQAMKENDLTREVLVPLFHALGYTQVDFHGGPKEKGKDLVCWKESEIGDVELTVAQVKRFQASAKAADSQSFGGLVNQLGQALEEALPHLDGLRYFPERVYFITPFPIDTAALQARFEGYAALRPRRVRIIDGPQLVKLLKSKLPEVFWHLLGTRHRLKSTIEPELTNEVLLRALETPTVRPVHTFFTDTDFAMGGRPSTRLFFSAELSGRETELVLDRNNWPLLQELNKIAERISRRSLFTEEPSHLNSAVAEHERIHEKWRKEHRPQADRYFQRQDELVRVEKRVKDLEKARDKQKALDVSSRKEITSSIQTARTEYQRLLVGFENLKQAYELSIRQEPRLARQTTIDGTHLAFVLRQERSRIESAIIQLSSTLPDRSTLGDFLRDCDTIFNAVRQLASMPDVAEAIGLTINPIKRSDEAVTRFALPINTIIDAGLNLTLLGDAGAGKTTTLQMYAYRALQEPESHRIIIFAPLIRILHACRAAGKWLLTSGDKTTPRLMDGLQLFLAAKGLHINSARLSKELTDKGGVILIDGIDEVFHEVPWILDSISQLASELPNIQIVTSSRTTGNYVERIPFFHLSLLPFTDSQQARFVRSWFAESSDTAEKVLKHLELQPELKEVTRNPLLSTVLCVLAEHSIRLPTTEVRLYDERLRLLLGVYDMHKGVRRIATHSTNLLAVAKHLAFKLHERGVRDESRGVLYAWSKDLGMGEEAVKAVEELIDPCNILLPTGEQGRFGFGHLRFQEHLAALEISTNRSIAIISLMRDAWWRGTLQLYASMQQNLAGLIVRLADAGVLPSVMETVNAMVAQLSSQQQDSVLSVLKSKGHALTFDL